MKFSIKYFIPVMFIFLMSCTLTSRRYMPGYSVEWNAKSSKENKVKVFCSIEKKRPDNTLLSFKHVIHPKQFTPGKPSQTTLYKKEYVPIRMCLPKKETMQNSVVATNLSPKIRIDGLKILTNSLPDTSKEKEMSASANKCFLFGFLSFLMLVIWAFYAWVLGVEMAGASVILTLIILFLAVIFAIISFSNFHKVKVNSDKVPSLTAIGLFLGIISGAFGALLLIGTIIGRI